MGDFPLHFKSTLDYLVYALAQANGFAYFDPDAVGMWATTQESEGPAIGWSMTHFSPDPVDPCYEAIVEVGPQTSLDSDQAESLKAISLVGTLLDINRGFFIADYSTSVFPTKHSGNGQVVEAQTEPSIAGRTSTMRMWKLRMKLTRHPR